MKGTTNNYKKVEHCIHSEQYNKTKKKRKLSRKSAKKIKKQYTILKYIQYTTK